MPERHQAGHEPQKIIPVQVLLSHPILPELIMLVSTLNLHHLEVIKPLKELNFGLVKIMIPLLVPEMKSNKLNGPELMLVEKQGYHLEGFLLQTIFLLHLKTSYYQEEFQIQITLLLNIDLTVLVATQDF